MKEILLPLLVGCGTGILSAWGVGGGTLLLLIMTLFLGVDPATARSVNLLYFLPTAAMGLITHRPVTKNTTVTSPFSSRAPSSRSSTTTVCSRT